MDSDLRKTIREVIAGYNLLGGSTPLLRAFDLLSKFGTSAELEERFERFANECGVMEELDNRVTQDIDEKGLIQVGISFERQIEALKSSLPKMAEKLRRAEGLLQQSGLIFDPQTRKLKAERPSGGAGRSKSGMAIIIEEICEEERQKLRDANERVSDYVTKVSASLSLIFDDWRSIYSEKSLQPTIKNWFHK